MKDAPQWGIEPVPERVARARAARRRAALGEPLRLAARDRRRSVARAAGLAVRPRALAPRGARGDRRRGGRRQPDARPRRPDRRRRARARDGAAARAARPPRLLPADRAEHPPVPRLVGVRADRDRDRGERALQAGARLRRRPVLEDPLRRRRDGARAARPGRLRAPLRAQVRGLGRDRLAPLPLLVVAARPARRPALWHRPGAHAFWPGFDLVLASIVSWTPLVADYTRFSRLALGRLLERRARLPRPDGPALRARRRDRDVAADQRGARAPDGDRGRRRRERARAARADRRRERRGVRERLLGRRLAPEPAARPCRSACSSRRPPGSRRSARC